MHIPHQIIEDHIPMCSPGNTLICISRYYPWNTMSTTYETFGQLTSHDYSQHDYSITALDEYLQDEFSFHTLFIFNEDHQIQYCKNGEGVTTNPSLLSSLMACMMALQGEIFETANKHEDLLTNITMQSGTDELKIMKYKENINGKTYLYYLLYSGSVSYAEMLLNDITMTLNEAQIISQLCINQYSVDLKVSGEIDRIIEGLLNVYSDDTSAMLNWI